MFEQLLTVKVKKHRKNQSPLLPRHQSTTTSAWWRTNHSHQSRKNWNTLQQHRKNPNYHSPRNQRNCPKESTAFPTLVIHVQRFQRRRHHLEPNTQKNAKNNYHPNPFLSHLQLRQSTPICKGPSQASMEKAQSNQTKRLPTQNWLPLQTNKEKHWWTQIRTSRRNPNDAR